MNTPYRFSGSRRWTAPIPGLIFALLMCLCDSWMTLPVRADGPAEQPKFDDQRSYDYLVKICRIGPRSSGSQGMSDQQALLVEHFSELKADVQFQTFDAADPLNGRPVRMNNLIVSWHPEKTERILLACHYDTRPFPDRDLIKPRGKFLGANDGASGVALFMELGHLIPQYEFPYGIDFVFFDGEELVYGKNGKYFLGSEHFAKQYRDEPPPHRYLAGVLVDMIADRDLNLYQEKNSLKFAPELTQSIWDAAAKLKVKEFIDRAKHEVQDDHLPLNEIAGIPTCDLIDFDYRHWHTTKDVPTQCSGQSLAKVGKVLMHWLQHPPDLTRLPKPN